MRGFGVVYDQSEQLRRRLFGQELRGLAEQLGRRSGTDLVDPGCLQLVGVELLVDEHRGDAEQQLCRLGSVDLHRERPAGARDIDDARRLDALRLLDVFDCHRTVTGTIALFRNFCLTSVGGVR